MHMSKRQKEHLYNTEGKNRAENPNQVNWLAKLLILPENCIVKTVL